MSSGYDYVVTMEPLVPLGSWRDHQSKVCKLELAIVLQLEASIQHVVLLTSITVDLWVDRWHPNVLY